jgi:hypothetical protein
MNPIGMDRRSAFLQCRCSCRAAAGIVNQFGSVIPCSALYASGAHFCLPFARHLVRPMVSRLAARPELCADAGDAAVAPFMPSDAHGNTAVRHNCSRQAIIVAADIQSESRHA